MSRQAREVKNVDHLFLVNNLNNFSCIGEDLCPLFSVGNIQDCVRSHQNVNKSRRLCKYRNKNSISSNVLLRSYLLIDIDLRQTITSDYTESWENEMHEHAGSN